MVEVVKDSFIFFSCITASQAELFKTAPCIYRNQLDLFFSPGPFWQLGACQPKKKKNVLIYLTRPLGDVFWYLHFFFLLMLSKLFCLLNTSGCVQFA